MHISRGLAQGLASLVYRFPYLQRLSGKPGIGRLLFRRGGCACVKIDSNIEIELDLAVPQYRALYLFQTYRGGYWVAGLLQKLVT